MATDFAALNKELQGQSFGSMIQSDTFKAFNIHVKNSNGDPNNPSVNLRLAERGYDFTVIEHLNPSGYDALSHEFRQNSATSVYLEGDWLGETFSNNPKCVNYIGDYGATHSSSQNSGHFTTDYNTGGSPKRSINDILHGNAGNDYIDSKTGNDRILGGGGDDRLYGGTGNDNLDGDTGRDFLFGEDGDDVINGGADDDFIQGGDGIDTMNGGTGDDDMAGDAGNDVMYGDDGNDIMNGGTGDDMIYGGAGNDTMFGALDNDTMFGEDGADNLNGGNGNDQLNGGTGNDTLAGGTGDDTLEGGSGIDVLLGGAGNDIYFFAPGCETVVVGEYAHEGTEDITYLVGIQDLYILKHSNDLIITPNMSDQMIFSGWFAGAENQGIDYLYFDALGTLYDFAAIAAMAQDITPTDVSERSSAPDNTVADLSDLTPVSIDILGISLTDYAGALIA